MFAAPIQAVSQQHPLYKISLLSWKDKIIEYSALEKKIPEMEQFDLHEIQKGLFLMLQENNVNVINQVISFLKAYCKQHPITQVPVEGLVTRVLNFYNIHGLNIEEVISIITQKSNRAKIIQSLGEGFTANSPKRAAKCYHVLVHLIKQYGLYQLMYLQGAIQDISAGFLSIHDEVKESVFSLMKQLYTRAGTCIIQYARFMKYPMLQKLQEFANGFIQVVPFETFPERMLYKEFSFYEKYPENFLDGMTLLKVKQLNECLKEMKEDSEKKNLKQDDFQGVFAIFADLAKRRTPTSSQFILSILNNLSERLVSFQSYSQILIQIIFELVNCKQLQQSLLSSRILGYLKFQNIESKFCHLSENQAQYHRAIKFFKLVYERISEYQRQIIVNYLKDLNLNYVYRMQLQILCKK